jgi:protocatechuate 4,5-dioxygenase alpha chain
MSLMKPENRARFKSNESAYLDEWSLTPAQKQAVLDRDYNAMIANGGNIYFLAKIFSSDGISFQTAAASMTDMNVEEYAAMMLHGGRSPEGLRSIKEGAKHGADNSRRHHKSRARDRRGTGLGQAGQ